MENSRLLKILRGNEFQEYYAGSQNSLTLSSEIYRGPKGRTMSGEEYAHLCRTHKGSYTCGTKELIMSVEETLDEAIIQAYEGVAAVDDQADQYSNPC